MIEFRARVSDKEGRKLYESAAYSTRAAAIADAFKARPKAKVCTTCYGVGLDIQWHKREYWGKGL